MGAKMTIDGSNLFVSPTWHGLQGFRLLDPHQISLLRGLAATGAILTSEGRT